MIWIINKGQSKYVFKFQTQLPTILITLIKKSRHPGSFKTILLKILKYYTIRASKKIKNGKSVFCEFFLTTLSL